MYHSKKSRGLQRIVGPFRHACFWMLGCAFDGDTVTSSAHAAPRLGFQLALTRSGRTMLRGGVGEFYDRVPLMIPAFQWFPDRTVLALNPEGQVTSSTAYSNQIIGNLRNPRSTAWNLALTPKGVQRTAAPGGLRATHYS